MVRPAKFADIKAGQYVGVGSVEQSDQPWALEVHTSA